MALHSAGAVREKKQTMAELKLRRLTELNIRLREDLDRPRVKVSDACQSYVLWPLMDSRTARYETSVTNPVSYYRMINYTKTTKDFMVPSTWGQVSLFCNVTLLSRDFIPNNRNRSTRGKILTLPNRRMAAA